MADQAGQTTPDASAVHVAAKGGNLDAGVDTLLEALLGQGHEGLLNTLVGKRLLVVHIAQLPGDLGKGRVVGVGEVVVVQQAGVRLLHKLAGGRVEGDVVKAVQGGLGAVCGAVAVGVAVLELSLTLVVGTVGAIQCLGVAGEREVAVNVGILAGQVGLVEVVGVLHERATQTGLNDDGGVGANQHGDAAGATGGAGVALGVKGNISSNDDSVTAVPAGTLNPVDRVDQGVGAAVAGVDGVDTLDVGVVAEKLHQHRLDRLGLVQEGLGADLKAADGVGVNGILLEQVGSGRQGEGVDVYGQRSRLDAPLSDKIIGKPVGKGCGAGHV